MCVWCCVVSHAGLQLQETNDEFSIDAENEDEAEMHEANTSGGVLMEQADADMCVCAGVVVFFSFLFFHRCSCRGLRLKQKQRTLGASILFLLSGVILLI